MNTFLLKTWLNRFFNEYRIGRRLGILTKAILISVIFLSSGFLIKGYFDYRRLDESLGEVSAIANAVDHGRGSQVHFKKQVQEWKNVLLRGSDPELLHLYWRQFEEEEKETKRVMLELRAFYVSEGVDTTILDQTYVELNSLGVVYRQALKNYTPLNNVNTFRVDKSVRGLDRAATDRMDHLVEQVQSYKEGRLREIIAMERRNFLLGAIVACVVVGVLSICMLWFLDRTIKSITDPLFQTMILLDSIGKGNLETPIPHERSDELGDLWRHLEQMQATLRDQRNRVDRMNFELRETLIELTHLKTRGSGDFAFSTHLIEKIQQIWTKSV